MFKLLSFFLENRPKIFCPDDVEVDLPHGALEVVMVELPNELFTDSVILTPAWITQNGLFPVGETTVTIATRKTLSDTKGTVLCSFKVNVNHE